jgi:hypothetical protein
MVTWKEKRAENYQDNDYEELGPALYGDVGAHNRRVDAAYRAARRQREIRETHGDTTMGEVWREMPTYKKVALGIGAVLSTTLILEGQNVGKGVYAFKDKVDAMIAAHKDPGAAERDSRTVYSGKFHIPTLNENHRELIVGETKDGQILSNIVSLRDYIHQKNPNISLDEAADLLMAENTKAQATEGIENIEPSLLQSGQHILLPMEYQVGDIVPGDQSEGSGS